MPAFKDNQAKLWSSVQGALQTLLHMWHLKMGRLKSRRRSDRQQRSWTALQFPQVDSKGCEGSKVKPDASQFVQCSGISWLSIFCFLLELEVGSVCRPSARSAYNLRMEVTLPLGEVNKTHFILVRAKSSAAVKILSPRAINLHIPLSERGQDTKNNFK